MGSIDKACISGFLCRLCSEMHRIVIHIYGDQGQRLCLVDKINGYLPITISPTDPLPKTICTTCLRRVEQHYDLLMRLSRIKEEQFLRVNNKSRPRVLSISSVDNSEDEVHQSDDESRRRLDILPQTQTSHIPTSTPRMSSTTAILTTARYIPRTITIASENTNGNAVDDDANDNGVANDNHSGASTSAGAMASITEHINVVNDALTNDPLSTETGNSFGIALQQNSD